MKVSPPAVLLIDLENMIGQKARPNVLIPRLDALLLQAGPGLEVVAACAANRITPHTEQILTDRGARLLIVGGAKDAADQALLDEARRLAARGRQRFVVASADSTFRQLATLGRLDIMLWETQEPQRPNAYTQQAHTVHRVPLPKTTGAPKTTGYKQREVRELQQQTMPVDIHVPNEVTTPSSDSPPSGRPDGETTFGAVHGQYRSPTPDASKKDSRRNVPKEAAQRSGAIFGAGILFGSGSVVGAHMARYFLRSFER